MSADRPNILFLMTDQMQGRVLDPGNPCLTPHFDRLAARGVRFPRAYTPNAVCSPARASLMTGLLPHSHGVLEVTHCVDDDQCNLRTEHPHWAQRLQAAGYRTGYFGKWHVERSNDLRRFGWEVDGGSASRCSRSGSGQRARPPRTRAPSACARPTTILPGMPRRCSTASPTPPRSSGELASPRRSPATSCATRSPASPWCCFVSVTEPHDPFVTGEAAFSRYDVDAIPLQPNVHDDLARQPGIYRKAGRTWRDMTDRQRREAAACYYASITEIDAQFGTLIDLVDATGRRDDTIVVLTSDHGELLGSHGLYCKNVGGFEEVYQIPLLISGPQVPEGVVSEARVGLHDLAPTLLELAGLAPIGAPDSRSFGTVLADERQAGEYTRGFAEYHGGRYRLTQRIIWDGPWKLVWNGFDFDELYHLDDDPYEMHNLIDDPGLQDRVTALMRYAWQVVRDTGDRALFNSHYPILRLAPVGPQILDEETPPRRHP